MSLTHACTAGDQAQLPYTLGLAPPEMLACADNQRHPMGSEKADVYAVGVMGLMWLEGKHELPFGPSRQQAQEVKATKDADQLRTSVQAARHSVIQSQHQWVS